jgi:Fe-S-cluster containining protein
LVFQINHQVEKDIDCTTCGACCKGLMINVTQPESDTVAEHLQMNSVDFEEKYIEKSLGGQMIINTIPCHFLSDSKCTIYEKRFNECREFPHLHKPNFSDRLFGTLIHYSICPIIFNVVEELKTATEFFNENVNN